MRSRIFRISGKTDNAGHTIGEIVVGNNNTFRGYWYRDLCVESKTGEALGEKRFLIGKIKEEVTFYELSNNPKRLPRLYERTDHSVCAILDVRGNIVDIIRVEIKIDEQPYSKETAKRIRASFGKVDTTIHLNRVSIDKVKGWRC